MMTMPAGWYPAPHADNELRYWNGATWGAKRPRKQTSRRRAALFTVAALLTRLELTGRRVAVELNQDIVPRSQHTETALTEGDQVEVVHAD